MTAPPSRKVFIRSYGCQMNVYDSERIADVLAPEGYSVASAPEDADLILLNTCHIRERAAEKVYSELGKLRQIKEAAAVAGRDVVIGVAGCVAQAEGEEIRRRAPVVDLVVGPQAYQRLPQLLATVAGGGPAVATDFAIREKFSALSALGRGAGTGRSPVSAFLTVQEGCDKFCTFCVVPYTRGPEVSRPAADIVAEAERLADGGARELTLLGQNVNAWRGAAPDGGRWGLARLLERLASVPGILRLRYTTSHPGDMDDALIAAHRDLPALMPYLHLPVQSGSDRVLAAMNRRHTAADYRALVARIRRARPDLALSSDFIVGFPGETDADFAATMALVAEVGYASAFTFKYSPRPGTPAAAMDQVDEAVKTDRLIELQALIASQLAAFNRSRVGTRMDVLIEGWGRRPGQLVGRSPWLQPVHVEGPADWIGTVRPLTIADAHANSLFAAAPPPVAVVRAEAAA